MQDSQFNTAATSSNDHQLYYPNLIASTLVDTTAAKRMRFDDEILQTSNLNASSSINERLLKLEEQVANLQATFFQHESTTTTTKDLHLSQRQKKAPRKGTMADVDAKLATILDILAKVVCPP